MSSLRIDTNAQDIIRNVNGYIEGVAVAPRNRDTDNEIGRAVTTIAQKSLSKFIDSEARLSPQSLHHVYEWNQTGKPLGRLWKVSGAYKSGAIILSSEFRQSRTFVPIKNGTVRRSKFVYKAKVMEAGKPVRITAKSADALFFYSSSGEPVFIPKGRYVTVRTPGGRYVKGAYQKTLNRFVTSSRLMVDIAESGMVKRLEDAQALAGRQMPISVSGKNNSLSLRRFGETLSSRNIRQVARAYQYVNEDTNG